MKKLLVEDIYKAVMSDRDKEIRRISDKFNIDISLAEELYKLGLNDSGIKEVLDIADKLAYTLEEANNLYISYQEENLDSWEQAATLLDNGFDQADWAEVVEWADILGIEPEGLEEDDFNNLQLVGDAKDEYDSEVGIIRWVYDNSLKSFLVYMALTNNSDMQAEPQEVLYRLDPQMMADWQESDSKGIYYNTYIRGNTAIEDPSISCGCGPNPCEQSQIDQFNTKYNKVS